MVIRDVIAGAWKSCARKGWWHWIRFAVLLAASWFAGQALKDSPYLTDLRYWVYRHQLALSSHGPVYPRRTALVVLDDDDYWGADFAGRSPLKRGELALIMDRLREAGANTVVLDVDLRAPHGTEPDFEFPDYQKKEEDPALLEAMGKMCDAGRNVVIGASVLLDGDDYIKAPSLFKVKAPPLVTADEKRFYCLQEGYLQFPYDLRTVPGQQEMRNGENLDSLSLKVVSLINPTAYRWALSKGDRGFHFARYLSEADYQPADGRRFVFNWQQLKKAKIEDVRRDIADKVVLIGGAWHANAQGQGPVVDTFHSPVGPLPGVFLHANYIEALDGERGTFAPLSDTTAEVIEFLLAIALALVAALEIHSGWKWGAFFTSLLLSVILTYVLLENLGIFLDFLIPILILIGHTLIEEVMNMRTELHHLKRHHERIDS